MSKENKKNKLKFALNPHERKNLKRFLGYLNMNYVQPAAKLINELNNNPNKEFVGSYCFRSFQFWTPFENDKMRLDYEIRKAIMEIEMAYKTVLTDGTYLDDSCKYMYRF